MDDALKAGGTMGGIGVAVVLVMLGYRVMNDDRLVWFVVGMGMLAFVVMLVIVALAMWRSAMEARAQTLSLSAERSLISSRAIRTLDGVQSRPAGGDILGQLIAGMPGGDVVDTGSQAMVWGDDGAESFGGKGE